MWRDTRGKVCEKSKLFKGEAKEDKPDECKGAWLSNLPHECDVAKTYHT